MLDNFQRTFLCPLREALVDGRVLSTLFSILEAIFGKGQLQGCWAVISGGEDYLNAVYGHLFRRT